MFSGSHLQTSGAQESWFNKLWSALMEPDHSVTPSSYQSQRALHATTMKLVSVQHQVDRLQAQHNLEMARLAQAYQALSKSDRTQLPEKLRNQLDRIEVEYF